MGAEPPSPQPGSQSNNPGNAASHVDDAAATVAAVIDRYGMSAPAAIGLQIARPLAWVTGQMLWVLQPFLNIAPASVQGRGAGTSMTGRSVMSTAGLASFLEGDENFDLLLERLSEPARLSPSEGAEDVKEHALHS
jgi:hypothetical protein